MYPWERLPTHLGSGVLGARARLLLFRLVDWSGAGPALGWVLDAAVHARSCIMVLSGGVASSQMGSIEL